MSLDAVRILNIVNTDNNKNMLLANIYNNKIAIIINLFYKIQLFYKSTKHGLNEAMARFFLTFFF